MRQNGTGNLTVRTFGQSPGPLGPVLSELEGLHRQAARLNERASRDLRMWITP
jgi:hypothetical protein